MFSKLTARAIDKVGQLQAELDEAKAKIAELERELAIADWGWEEAVMQCMRQERK